MKKESPQALSRRSLLRVSALGAGAASLAAIAMPSTATAQGPLCRTVPTPMQPEGPFYPIHDQLDKDNDLTTVAGQRGRASGQLIYVMGQILDEKCQPVKHALVEIWQACKTGCYNHENDPNPAPLDPNFQYFGRVITGADGKYIFRTILPGEYPAGDNWVRPPHIHFRVAKRGYFELITQMYFAGHKLNERDRILQSLSPEDRQSVVIEFQKPDSRDFEPDSAIGRFDIALKKV